MTVRPDTMDRPTLVAALLCTQAVLRHVTRLDLPGGVVLARRGPAWTIAVGDRLLARDGLWEPIEELDLTARALPDHLVAHLERTAWALDDALVRVGFHYDAPDTPCDLVATDALTTEIEQ